ncbi:MAG: post-transcriptional regulator [Clostridia bacterium]
MDARGQLPHGEWYETVSEICLSKAEEFSLMGYDSIGPEDVWKCVAGQYKQVPPLHQLVNDILSLKITKYMNWVMISMYKNPDSI